MSAFLYYGGDIRCLCTSHALRDQLGSGEQAGVRLLGPCTWIGCSLVSFLVALRL